MAFSRIFKHVLQNQYGFDGGVGVPKKGGNNTVENKGDVNKQIEKNCLGAQVGYVYSETQKKCIPCTADSQCVAGQKCQKSGVNKGKCQSPPPPTKNQKTPPQKNKIDYRAWFKQNNVADGLVGASGLENEFPFKEWNYAIYHVDQDTLLPRGQGFPAGTSAMAFTSKGVVAGEPYYWSPGELKDKKKKGHGHPEDAPILYPGTTYYAVMRVYNTGEKTWGSKGSSDVVGMTFTHKSATSFVDKNLRKQCKVTINDAQGAHSVCSAPGSVLALQNKQPLEATSAVKNKWFDMDLLDDTVFAKFESKSGQVIRSKLKDQILTLPNTRTAVLLRELEKNCSKNISYSDAQVKKLAKELFRADNFFEFMYVITGWDGGKCNTYEEPIARPKWLKCNFTGGNEACVAAGETYVDGYCNIRKMLRSRWGPDPATSGIASLDIRTAPDKIFPLDYPPTAAIKLYTLLMNGFDRGGEIKPDKDNMPKCSHAGFGKTTPPNTLPAGLGYPSGAGNGQMKSLKKGGAESGISYPKSPLITPYRCKLETTTIKENQSQPDSFYNYGQPQIHCKDPNGIYGAHKKMLKTYIHSGKDGKKLGKLWADMTPKVATEKTDKGDVAYFGFYFKTPPKKEITDSIDDKGNTIPTLYKLRWDLVVPKAGYSKAPTPFLSWQTATTGKGDPDHANEAINFYITKQVYPGVGHMAKKITQASEGNVTLKPVPNVNQLDSAKAKVLKTVQQTVDEDLKKHFWFVYNMDKFQLAPYNNGTYFIHDHFLGPVEDGFVAKGSLGTTTDKYRKYANALWQIAREPSNKLDEERGVAYGAYGVTKISDAPPKIIFNYDYQIRKAVMPEVTAKETAIGATGGGFNHAVESALRKARNQNLSGIRDRLYYWMRTTGRINKHNIHIRNLGYPQLVDTGFVGQSIPYATNEDLEELIKIEAISRKTFPHNVEEVQIGGKNSGKIVKDAGGDAVKIYCQHPYNIGVFSSPKKCSSQGTIKPILRNNYKPGGKLCSENNPCTVPGYKCDSGACVYDLTLPEAKDFLKYDYKIQIRGIIPGYDLKDKVVMADSYQAPDWYYGKPNQETDLAKGSLWAYRQVQPGPVVVNLQQGDFFDRMVWGHSTLARDWQPTGKWLMPSKNEKPYNPIKNMNTFNPRAKRLEESTRLDQRPTLELSEPPVADVVQEMIDTMERDDWIHDYNFMYKPWVKNDSNLLEFVQEMEVKTVVNYVGKCAAAEEVKNINELSLPFAYESNPATSDPTADPQKKMDGRFIGITSKSRQFQAPECIGTLYDTSVVSIHPNTLDLILPKGPANALFNKQNPIYNKITFDILNERVDKPKGKTTTRKFMFNGMSEDERKEIFDYVVGVDHNQKTVPVIKTLIAENLGALDKGRPYFEEVRQIPTTMASNIEDVEAGVIDLDVVPGKKGELKKKSSNVKRLLNDALSEKAGPKPGGDDPNQWIFQNKSLKKEYFRDYQELTRGALANYETIAYKVVKSTGSTKVKEGDTYKSKGEQVFYIFPNFKFPDTDKNRKITLIDTQIKLGVEYNYDLYAVTLVYGTKYKYGEAQLIKEYKEIATNEEVAENKLENYRDYVSTPSKTPLKATLAQSAQKVLIGPHDKGAQVGKTIGNTTTGAGAQTIGEAGEAEWYGLPDSGLPSLPHKLRFVNSYTLSAYVDARPALGIFEVPLLRRGAVKKTVEKSKLMTLAVATTAEEKTQIEYGTKVQPALPSGLNASLVSGAPLPPSVEIVPYSKTNNKVLFLFQKMEGLEKVVATPERQREYADIYKKQQKDFGPSGTNQLLPNEMYFGYKDPVGAHTHGHQKNEVVRTLGNISDFIVYKTSGIKPRTLSDFGEPYAIVPKARASFIEDIEPNIKYYYAFRARGTPARLNTMSFVTKMHSVELVDRGAAVIPYIDVIKLEADKKQEETSINFKKRLRIKPAFLQALPRVLDAKKTKAGQPTSDLGYENIPVWQPMPNKDGKIKNKGDDMPKWKFRITSNSTQRKIDLNVFFRKSVKLYQPLSEKEMEKGVKKKIDTATEIELRKLRELNLREDIVAGIYKKILSYNK